MGRHGKVDR
jgi:hypothetical protein